MAPGSHDAKSVTGATDEFGISAINNGGTATVGEWLHDNFIARLLDRAVERLALAGDQEKKSARALAERAIHSAAEADHHDPERTKAWALLSRLLSVGSAEESIQAQWSRACGVPPCADGSLQHENQQGILDDIVELVETSGFGACATRMKEAASEAEQHFIDEMIGHLRGGATSQLALKHAPEYHFAPDVGTELAPAPAWWSALTAERLRELLGSEAPRPETLGIEVINRLIPPMPGLPVVVRDASALAIGTR